MYILNEQLRTNTNSMCKPRSRLRSTVGNVSGNRCESDSDCRSRGHELDPGPVPYFRGD